MLDPANIFVTTSLTVWSTQKTIKCFKATVNCIVNGLNYILKE